MQSVRSLRLYNRAIPVCLFLFTARPPSCCTKPSWIIEQIALWLTLGHLPRLSFGTLSRDLVPQGGEFKDVLLSRRRCVVADYYSGTEDELFSPCPLSPPESPPLVSVRFIAVTR